MRQTCHQIRLDVNLRRVNLVQRASELEEEKSTQRPKRRGTHTTLSRHNRRNRHNRLDSKDTTRHTRKSKVDRSLTLVQLAEGRGSRLMECRTVGPR